MYQSMLHYISKVHSTLEEQDVYYYAVWGGAYVAYFAAYVITHILVAVYYMGGTYMCTY